MNPINDQGIAETPSSAEPVVGIGTSPARPEPPRYEDDELPVRRKSGGLPVLLIVLLVFGAFVLGSVVVGGGLVVLGSLFFVTTSRSTPMAAPPAATKAVPIRPQIDEGKAREPVEMRLDPERRAKLLEEAEKAQAEALRKAQEDALRK